MTFTYYVFRNSTGRLSVSMVHQDETVATFSTFDQAIAYRNEQNGIPGWQRELTIASEQARAA